MDKLPSSVDIVPNICMDFLMNLCERKRDTCSEVHTKFPFLWQFKIKQQWHNFPENHGKELELKFRVPKSDGVQLTAVDLSNSEEHFSIIKNWYANFDTMAMVNENQRLEIRRLSTESSAVKKSKFSTDFEWFFRDEKSRWIPYGQPAGRPKRKKTVGLLEFSTVTSSDDIEKQFSVNGLKIWKTHNGQHTYDFDFVKMRQSDLGNPIFHFTKRPLATWPMRRRPKAGKLNPGSGPAEDYTSQPVPGNSVTRSFKWQFMDEQRNWIDYGQASSVSRNWTVSSKPVDIENEFAKNPNSAIEIQLNSNRYSLDFRAMKQTNLRTRITRDVRRVLENPAPSVEYEWFFRDKNNQWVKYGQISSGHDDKYATSQGSDDIEKHFQSQPEQVMIVQSNMHTYELNLSTMTQTNVKTQGTRAMSRRTKNCVSNIGSDVVSTQYVYEWYFKENDSSWVKFGEKDIYAIEKHYLSKPTTNFNFTAGNQSYVLDFTAMTQTNTATGKVREVCRRHQLVSMTRDGSCSPSCCSSTKIFTEFPSGQTSFEIPLGVNQTEYKTILALLRSTLLDCKPSNIFEVNNPYLKAAFEIKKAQLQKLNPSISYKEECLFHGTSTSNVKAIREENLDWRLHGSNKGQALGRGTYFSNSARLSRKYGDVIFVCKVLVGRTALGNSNTVIPAKDKYAS
ncbi:protein mono-ADP-ribosyltransferase PARP12-like [Hyalella azteca]|uniref:Poly [ADP-ribose] polymerase n=1 Tax=Hyalella azteca TaxID=294128 RepID=A0A979FIQ9_HYAAZ|nr:protein mono-ADP-ribosyltransferase PARP12-like [Hyalella azteca]